MNEGEYRSLLAAELAAHTASAASRVRQVLQNLPAKALALEFEIFPDQDGEGTFSVYATLDGPDLYVLSKAIRPHAEIFVAINTPERLEPPVPYLDPSIVDFEVNDVLVDVVADWMKSVWEISGTPLPKIPVRVVGHEDYGTITPVVLHLA